MADANKIKYGICNVHYAKITGYNVETKKYTYATPVPFPGAVRINLSAAGSSNPFYADNIVYSNSETNTGYEGDIEMARIIDDFRKDILSETYDEAKKQWYESADAVTSEFALLFEFDGDVNKTRHIMYRCKTERPDIASSTKEETADPQTETLAITAMARENDHVIKSRVGVDGVNYATWYDEVNEPSTTITTYTEEQLNAMNLYELTEIAKLWNIDTEEITTKAALVSAIIAAQPAAA